MTAVGRIMLAAVAVAAVVPALAGEIYWYGRAGGAVSAERAEQVASYVSPQDLREFDAGYGRAGDSAATAPVRATSERKVDVAAAWFGRAGGPLPFSG